jgi:cell division protein FtsL
LINAQLATQHSPRSGAAALNIADARPYVGATTVDARSATRDRTARRGGKLISSFAVFSMVIITMFALCFTVTMRTHAEMQSATVQYETMNAEVESLRNTNTALKQQVERLRTDPRAIEAAARERLGMVRPNDIIIPVR